MGARHKRCALKPLRLLQVNREATALAKALVEGCALPPKATTDALHIALAAVHRMHFLLTWNCTHINNVATIERIREICSERGWHCPVICTPDELIRI